MTDSTVRPVSWRSWFASGLVLFAFVVIGVVAQWPAWSRTPVFSMATLIASVTLCAAALTLWRHSGRRRLAFGLFVSSGLWSLQWLTTWNISILPFIGVNANGWFYAAGALGYLRPSSRFCTTRLDRVLVVAFPLVALASSGSVFTSQPEWSGFDSSVWWPHVDVGYPVFEVVNWAIFLAWLVLATSFTSVVVSRFRMARGFDRAMSLPVVIGFCSVGMLSATTAGIESYPTVDQTFMFFLLSCLILFIPAGVLISATRGHMRQIGLSTLLSRRLSQQVLTGEFVRQELRDALVDPSLDLYFWAPDVESYVSIDGTKVGPVVESPHGLVRILRTGDDQPLVAITVDSSLERYKAVLDIALGASVIALKNVQLQAIVRSQLKQVHASRARIIEATLEERRRIERDLHDGVQQRLLALQAQFGVLRREDRLDEALVAIADDLRSVVTDLRDLAHGIHPSELRQFGLKGAMQVVLEKLPLDVTVAVTDKRYAPMVEATIYFVACEAFSNVVKHARATHVDLTISDAPASVSVAVVDNGKGGANMRSGGGLEGLADRVRTLRGEFSVVDTGAGTRLLATVPIARDESGLALQIDATEVP